MISPLPVSSTPPDIANSATPPGEMPVLAPAIAATPFDFILALEALAASAAEQQAAAATAGAATLDGVELPEIEDGNESGELDDDAEDDSLEFLAGLLSAIAPRPVAPAPSAASSVSAGDAGDAGTEIAAAPSGSTNPASNPEAVKDTSGNAGGALVLAGMIAGQAADADADADAARPVMDSVTTPTRANELLAPTARPAHAPEQAAVSTHIRDPRWADDFSTRITTMVRAGESQAALQLSPLDLGPVDVTVTVRDSNATIHFGAAQAETRALIEASLPKLREMMAAQGFNLLDASVSQGFTQQGKPELAGVPRPGIDSPADTEVVLTRHVSGLLDLYA